MTLAFIDELAKGGGNFIFTRTEGKEISIIVN